jgi:hypothetical protein
LTIKKISDRLCTSDCLASVSFPSLAAAIRAFVFYSAVCSELLLLLILVDWFEVILFRYDDKARDFFKFLSWRLSCSDGGQ